MGNYRDRIDKKKKEREEKSNSSSLTSRDRIDKTRMENTIGFDTLQSDLDSLSSQYTSMYDGWQTQETMKNVTSSMEAMRGRLNTLNDYTERFGMEGIDDIDSFKSQINNYRNYYTDAIDSIKQQGKVYKQYKDANSYAKDKTELEKLSSMTTEEVAEYLKSDNPIAYTTQTGRDITWQGLYDEKRYNDILKSGEGDKGWKQYLSDKSAAEEAEKKDKEDEKWYEFAARMLGNSVDTSLPNAGLSQAVYEKQNDDSYKYPTDEWTEEEQRIFGAYYLEDKDEAFEYATKVNNNKNRVKKDTEREELVDDATSSFGMGALHTLGSLATAPLGLADYLDDLTDSVAGRPILEGSVLSPFEYSQTVQSGIGEYLNEYGTLPEDIPVLGGAGLGDLYGLGTSMAQSIASAYTLGPVGMGISYFGQGAAAGVDDALSRGATDDEALLYGASVGTPEAVLEAITGHLLTGLGKGGASLGKQILGQGGEEALEEGLTSVVSQIADNIIMQDKSAFSNAVRTYMSQGMSESEATEKAWLDAVEGITYDSLMGFLSGTGNAGIVAPINSYTQNSALGSAIRENQNLDELKGIAEELGGEYKDYLEMLNGENVSDANVGKAFRKVGEGVASNLETSRSNDVMRAIADRANELGDSKNSGMIASAVQKTIDGKKLSAEEKAIMKTDTAQTIMEDINRGEIVGKHSENFKNASDLRARTENLLTPTSKSKATGEKLSIEGIKKADGKTLIVTNNGEMAASDIDFAENQAKLVEYTKGMSEEMANLFVSQYDNRSDVDHYKAQFDLAYSYGESEFGVSAILNRTKLSPSQASAIYTTAKDSKYAARQKVVDNLVKEQTSGKFVQGKVNESAIDYTNSGNGEVNWNNLSKAQQRHIAFQNALYTGLGINVKWTTKGKEGNFNGYYDGDKNEIVLDVYAGVNKDDPNGIKDENLAIMRTSSHEITHWMEKKSPELYKALKEHIFDSLRTLDGKSDAERIMTEMSKNSDVKTEEQAISEIVARGCEDMLAMSDLGKEVIGKMTGSEKKTFFGKVKEVFKDMIEFIDKLLGQFNSKSYEAIMLRNNKEALEKQLALWEEGLKSAVVTNQAMTEKGLTDKDLIEAVEKVGVSIDAETESAYPSETFSRRTWEESDYVVNREVAAKNLAKALKISQKKALKYIDDINSVARMIADDKARLDYEPNMDDSASVMKPNSDYKWSIDMSTLCAKRLLFTGTFDAIQKALPNTVFSSEDIVKLRKMMMDRAYEVACGICYVESTRREIGAITQQFIDSYKESQRTGKPITRTNSEGKVIELKKTKDQMKTTVDKSTDRFIADKDYTPTLGDLNTTDIDIVKKEHPLVYEAYLNFMNARGQSKPKLLETRAEYKGEVAKTYKRKKDGSLNNSTVAMNESGGLRLQSFSDFEVAHLIDMMQVVMDMSQAGLYSQAYTKVPAFAEVFGDTGVKINLSLIAKGSGLDANGNLIFDDVEGINHEEAFRLREKYSKNVGTILVGKNDEHIIKAMADPRIDYIIPFHKSSWKESLYDALGLTGYDDYTDTQHEKALDKNRKISDFKPSEYWDYSKSGDENAKIYLDKCKEDGRIPKFPQFQGYEGYWKLLIDFKMYDNDGVGSPQTAVMPNFDMDSANRILNEYEGGHRKLPVAKDVVEDFVSEYRQYSSRDSEGSELTEAQAEYFKDSKVRDENGNLKVMYHGSKTAGFTVFDYNAQEFGLYGEGFYFTDDDNVADGYSKDKYGNKTDKSGVYQVYLNVTNPLDMDALADKGRWILEISNTMGESEDFVRSFLNDFISEQSEYRNGVEEGIRNSEMFYVMKNVFSYLELNKYEAGETAQDIIKNMGYDGITHIGGGRYNKADANRHRVYIAFENNQIKNIDNTNPTDSDDIRYARRRDLSYDVFTDPETRQKARELVKQKLDEHDERIAKKTTISRIRKNTRSLNEYLMKNSKDKHVPEHLKPMVRSLVQAIDYETSRTVAESYNLAPTTEEMEGINNAVAQMTEIKDEQRLLYAMTEVRNSLEFVEFYGLGIEGEIDSLITTLKGLRDNNQYPLMVLSAMNMEQLATIDKLVQAVKSVVNFSNKLHTIKRNLGVDELGGKITRHLDGLGKGTKYNEKINKLVKTFKWLNAVPYYAFNRLGSGGKILFGSLQDGWDKMAFNIKTIYDFVDGIKDEKGRIIQKGAYTKEEVKKWTEEVNEITIRGKKYQMTTSQIMSLYCLSKRKQAMKHILGHGIRIADFGEGIKVVNQTEEITVTEEDVKAILSVIKGTRAEEVAQAIQHFMNTTCTDWGNYVSMARFGYNAFGEENYFPIQVNEKNISQNRTQPKQNTSLYALLNMGFTKSLDENSKNVIMVNDIFDVFANHASEMAKYNALGLAVLDFNRVMNYSEKRNNKPYSIRTAMETAYGNDAEAYFNKLIADLNGTQNVSRDVIGKGMLSRAKLGAIGFNAKTVILQPTAYVKAGAILKTRYLTNPIVASPKMVKRGIERAKKYCGIALWKSMGFYDTNISRGVVEQIKKQETLYDKLAEKSTKWMERADEITWGTLWNACELEIKDTRKDLKVGSDEYFGAVAERLREIIYATQVVDSTLTRSEMMRSGDNMDKLLTAFGSETTLAYNMLLDCVMEHDSLKRSGANEITMKEHRRKVARVVSAYTITNFVCAIVESVVSAYRDEDEYEEEEFFGDVMKAFASNMSVIGKIPYLKDIVSIFQGYSASRMDTQGFTSLYYAYNSIIKNMKGEGSVYSTFKHLLKATSSFSGLGFWNMHRDIMALMYQLDIFSTEELKELLDEIIE